MHAVRYQVVQIRDALVEVRQSISDPVAKVEAQALPDGILSFFSFAVLCGVTS